MSRLIAGLTMLLFLWGIPIYASADLYSWTDGNGVKHFTNEPPPEVKDVKKDVELKVDEEAREALERQRARKQDEVAGKVPAGASKYVTQNPGKVVLYSTPGDLHMDHARSFFKKYSIPFEEYNIDKDEEAKARLEQQFGDSYPCIIVGSKRYKGFDNSWFNGLFGIGGARITNSNGQ